MSALASDAVVQRRPHFRREGAEVRFLISRRATLTLADDDEIALFDAVGAPTAVTLLPAHALVALAAWHDAEVIDVIPPRAAAGRPLVAIEPHMDDVVLSAGGRLLLHRGKRPVVLLSVTRDSNVSGYWSLEREFFDEAAVTALRIAESDRVVDLAGGGEHRSLGIPDAPLRFRPAHEWTADSFHRLHDALAPYLGFPPLESEVRDIARRLAEEVLPLDPAELWIPLGLGGHIDHRTTRAACLRMIAEHWGRFARIPILLYEDHPYATYFPSQLRRVVAAFEARGTKLVPEPIDITSVFEEKVRLVGVYASQFKARAMEPNLRRRAAETGDDGRLVERAHRLETRPLAPAESELAPDAPELARMRRRMAPWLARRESIRDLTIVAGAALGRYEDAMRLLLEMFPNARIHLLVAETFRWETESWSNPRLDVRSLRSLPREALRIGAPAILIRFAPWPLEDRWREQILK
ncbi:MAG TPA: PIG-L family deacetylase, partial [Thermoanaerobaculia bacterium]|nr:PIG-L family deacetylase [Thermoanaerobaculia bacterium]